MKIILLRHGKPEIENLGKLKAGDLNQWIESYNASGVHLNHSPPAEAFNIAKECNIAVCSDFRRSIESAKLLGITEVKHIDPLFREMGLP